jgi:haloalkane dehalogenase
MNRTTAPELPAWLSAHLTAFDRYMVDVGGRRMHVMEAGDPEGRPVLMLHGNPTWGFLYRKVVAELGDAPLRLVVPDLLGLGFSDRIAAHEHTIENHSAWLGALIDGLDLRDLVFVGQDWGGPIGTHALSTRADRVHGLVIMNTIVGPPKPDFTPTPFHRFAATPVISDLVFRLLGFPQINLNLAQGDRTSMSGEVGRAYRYPLRNLALNAAPLALARMVPDSLQHHSVASLRQCFGFVSAFEGPAAIVWGDRDPILGRVRTHIERTLPHADVTRTQAGHFLQEEVPAEIAAAIREVAGGQVQ